MTDLLEAVQQSRPLLATLAGVAGLLFLIIHRRVNAFTALIGAALATGLAAGLAPAEVITSISDGFGGVLGFIAVIVGLGAILGAYLEASGGARALASAVIGRKDSAAASWAMGLVGLVIAIPVFFDVGLVLLFPLILSLGRKASKHPLYFGLPLLAGLAVAHAFIPPTPGPVAVAEILSADIGLVIVCGLAAGIPAMVVAGPVFAQISHARGWLPNPDFSQVEDDVDAGGVVDTSKAFTAAIAILVPVVLIVAAALASALGWRGALSEALAFVGHPFVALLIACALAALILGADNEENRVRLQDTLARAFEPTAVILLVTGAGGAFKQVLVDTGAGAMLAENLLGWGITPLIAGFLLALMVRVAQGSATVAMLTAAGLIAPVAAAAQMSGVDLALLTIAIASGASMVSHVNDSGFWLVSRYFQLSAGETLRSWTIASTLVGLVGFVVAMLISLFT